MDSDLETPPSARSDLISGAVWVVIGVAIGIGSWRMDRLASQGVPGFAAPGLLPGILGVLIAATGLAIVLRSLRRGALAPPALDGAGAALLRARGAHAGVVPGLCRRPGRPRPAVSGGSGAVPVRAHLPVAAARAPRGGPVLRGTLVAAAIAVVAAGVISFVFQYAVPGAPALRRLRVTMLEGLYALGRSLAAFFTFWPIAYALGATLIGILVGCMPGLSATLAIALLTTLTIKMPPNDAILILICAYVGAIYGGSRTAILLNIPGTAANAAACLDGYQLARKGQAGRAMGIATCGSVAGSLFGIVCLALLTPSLGEVALSFGAFEFFWLALFGVMMSGIDRRQRPAEGLADGLRRPVRHADRPGRHARARPLHLRLQRSVGRPVADPGADRRVRPVGDPHRAVAAGARRR